MTSDVNTRKSCSLSTSYVRDHFFVQVSPYLKNGVGLRVVLYLALMLFIGSSATITYTRSLSTVFYVAPNGDDGNPGTFSKPWQHINYATQTGIVQPGDTIYIRGGVYNESIVQKISGSPNNPITYRNYPGETPIISDIGVPNNWRWQILDQSHIIIEGITFSNYRGGAIQIRTINTDLTDIKIVNSSFDSQRQFNGTGNKTIHITSYDSGRFLYNIAIQNNSFYNLNTGGNPVLTATGNVRNLEIIANTIINSTDIGIDIVGRPNRGQPENVLIKDNDISEHGSSDSDAAGIYLDGAGKYIVVEGNIVHHGFGKGIKVNLEAEAASLETRYVIVRRNILYNNKQINLMIGTGGALTNCPQSGRFKDSVAVHNTIVSTIDNTTNNYFSCGENLRWKNNLLDHTSPNDGYQYNFVNGTVNPSTWQIDYNFFHSNGAEKSFRWKGVRYNSLTSFQGASAQDQNSREGFLHFTDLANLDFHLPVNSPAQDTGGSLTTTSGSGNGTVIPVVEAWYFTDGLGLQDGDQIQIGNNAPVTVVAVDYARNEVTINRPISWTIHDPVSYNYSGSSPDPGAYELGPYLSLKGTPADQKIILNWSTNEVLPPSAVLNMQYDGPIGDQVPPITDIAISTTSYTLTGLTNYTWYNITLSVVYSETLSLTDTINVMPTDKFVYLPLTRK